jgi:hypothetical protein
MLTRHTPEERKDLKELRKECMGKACWPRLATVRRHGGVPYMICGSVALTIEYVQDCYVVGSLEEEEDDDRGHEMCLFFHIC